MTTRLALLAALLVSAACSGSPDITGLYRTTERRVSQTDCSGGEPADLSPPYFRIEEMEFFGVTLYSRSNCETEDSATCEGGGGLLSEETDDGYRGWISFSVGAPPDCTLSYVEYQASLDGDQLTFETRTFSETGDLPCTTDEAEARGSDMPCVDYELIAGVLVE